MNTTQPSALKSWILALRPRTLTATLAPVIVGAALSRRFTPDLSWFLVSCALLCTLFLQLTSNLVNDVSDFKKGTDTAERLGPLRATANGWLTPRAVWIGAIICIVGAILSGLPLILAGGLPLLILGAASVLAAVAYTAGPFPLAYLGLGELFVLIFFGWVAVSGLVYALTGSWFVPGSWLAATQVGLLTVVMIAVNNLRDINGDRQSGKRTLAARFGERFIRGLIAFCLFTPYVMGVLWWPITNRAFFLPLMALPFGFKVWNGLVATKPSKEMNRFLGMASMHLLLFGLLLSLGLVWL